MRRRKAARKRPVPAFSQAGAAFERVVAQAPGRLQEPLAAWLASDPGRLQHLGQGFSWEGLLRLWAGPERAELAARSLARIPEEQRAWLVGSLLGLRDPEVGVHLLQRFSDADFEGGLLRSLDLAHDATSKQQRRGEHWLDVELWVAIYSREPEMAQLVRTALTSNRPGRRWIAAQHYHLFPELDVAELGPALHDEDPEVRRWAAWQFAHAGQPRPGVADILWEAARARWTGGFRAPGPHAVGMALTALAADLPSPAAETLPFRVDPLVAAEAWYAANDRVAPARMELVDSPREAVEGACQAILEATRGRREELGEVPEVAFGSAQTPWSLELGWNKNPVQELFPYDLQPGYLRAALHGPRPAWVDSFPRPEKGVPWPLANLLTSLVADSGYGSFDRPWVLRLLPLLPHFESSAHRHQLLALERLSRSTGGWIALADSCWVSRRSAET